MHPAFLVIVTIAAFVGYEIHQPPKMVVDASGYGCVTLPDDILNQIEGVKP